MKSRYVIVKSIPFTSFLFLHMMLHAQNPENITVHFEFDRYDITDKSAAIIDSTINTLTLSEIDSVIITGHCDPSGTDTYNDKLSLLRAEAVKIFMMKKMISASNFIIHGYGEKKLISFGNSSADSAANRRAEIQIFSHPQIISISSDTIIKTHLEELDEGEKLILHNINFYGGTHEILPSSEPVLNELVVSLNQNPAIEIEIQGYVCCTPENMDGFDSETFTEDLSVQRALAIYKYLVAHGINSSRLRYKGYGSIKLVEEKTEADRTINRRVEIKVIKK